MIDRGRSVAELTKMWQTLDYGEKNIVCFLVYSQSPVSIDTLSALSGAPAVSVLNVMEELRKRKFIYEKKEFRKGTYFMNGTDLAILIQKEVPEEETRGVLRKTIEFYNRTFEAGTEKTLALAELYRKLGANGDGLKHIKDAAEFLIQSGQREKAALYYDYLLESIGKSAVTSENAGDFLDGILGKISGTKHLMPIQEQTALLSRAEKVARLYEKWDYLTKIELALGQTLQAAGQHKKAFQHMNDFWKLAEKIGDQRMLKIATLLTGDFFHWKGKFSEVVRRYEEVVGDLEEFGDDEATLKAAARVGLCYVRCGRIARGLGMIETVRAKANLLGFQHGSIFADLMTTLALFEIRKVTEAEFYMDRISALPDDVVGHYILWPIEACKAYILCQKEKHEEAFESVKRAVKHSRFVGWMHQNGAWNFDYLDILESKGFVLPGWNYDGEIKRMLSWDDIYTKGIAFKYRALRNAEKQQSASKILSDLENSEKYLKKAGAEIELARTRIALGNFYLKRGDEKIGHSYIDKAWRAFSKVDQNLFPNDLLVIMPQEQKIKVMIDRIIGINQSLGTVHDASSFLERVLSAAMEFTGAMRGAFFTLEEGGKPTTFASRNLDPLLLKAEQFELISEVIADVGREGTELVMPGMQERGGLSEQSLVAAGISSLVCMPVILGEEAYGYLYLDSRLGGKPFPDNHLLYVRLLCSQIAVGLFNIKILDEMRERKDRFEDEAIFYKREMGVASPLETIIGKSEGIRCVLDQIRQVAPSDSSVLIVGETGVGKELVAKAIHSLSDRRDGPFIPVNLAALPQELVASELFGHEKGAFTGANERYKGRFELADGGTIFLDEVSDLPTNIQVKLLRVLQEGTFERLGSAKSIRSDFRVVAATNKDLLRAVENGTFRQDLYYRLNVIPVHVPPLRERKEDIPPIAHHFLDKFSRRMGKPFKHIPNEEIKKIVGYHWPGNVRELEHVIERAVILCDGSKISFSGFDHPPGGPVRTEDLYTRTMEEMEREHIEKTLSATHWKVGGPSGAAALLGMKPTTLFFRMKKLAIKGRSGKESSAGRQT
jgi:transcriptional regulator with GAF, ATPase, and Fis domain